MKGCSNANRKNTNHNSDRAGDAVTDLFPGYLTLPEVAKAVRRHPRSIQYAIERKQIRPVEQGLVKAHLFLADEVERFAGTLGRKRRML